MSSKQPVHIDEFEMFFDCLISCMGFFSMKIGNFRCKIGYLIMNLQIISLLSEPCKIYNKSCRFGTAERKFLLYQLNLQKNIWKIIKNKLFTSIF